VRRERESRRRRKVFFFLFGDRFSFLFIASPLFLSLSLFLSLPGGIRSNRIVSLRSLFALPLSLKQYI